MYKVMTSVNKDDVDFNKMGNDTGVFGGGVAELKPLRTAWFL